MHQELIDAGWTEEHWNRICSTVAEEAQKARVAAQILPISTEGDSSTVAIPDYALTAQPIPVGAFAPETFRLAVNSQPNLPVTTISVTVPLRSHEMAQSDLSAALVMFRRAANIIARAEDALLLNGRPGANQVPPGLLAGGIAPVFRVRGESIVPGIYQGGLPAGSPTRIAPVRRGAAAAPANGNQVFDQVIDAINALEGNGHMGPFACALSATLFAHVCTPTNNLVLPRDRLLPVLEGPLVRSSLLPNPSGIVLATSGNPVELVRVSDVSVHYLQVTAEPRYEFRLSERLALRIKDPRAIALLG